MCPRNAVLLTGLMLACGSVMAIEEPQYEVVVANDDYEIRSYEPYILAETEISGDFDQAGNGAFRVLAGYIFGNNRSARPSVEIVERSGPVDSERMAMTAPVFSTAPNSASTDKHVFSFVMPARYSLDALPVPLDSRVSIRRVSGRVVAVRRYSGRWSERSFTSNEAILRDALERDGLTVLGTAQFARYNAPYVPWFMRRNEVMLEIEVQPGLLQAAPLSVPAGSARP